MDDSLTLTIADITFTISCTRKKFIRWLSEHCRQFISGKEPDISVSVNIDTQWKALSAVFTDTQASWHNERFYIATKFFVLDIDFFNKKASVVAGSDLGIMDLLRFLSNILLMKNGGLLLHASAILRNGVTYVFFGPSGSGKTTIAQLSEGTAVLNDETVAIRKTGGFYQAYATPFFGEYGRIDKNASAPIKAMFHINKDIVFDHQRLKGAQAAQELLCNIAIQVPEPVMVDSLFEAVTGLVKEVPCYSLYFKQDPSLWRYIDGFIE